MKTSKIPLKLALGMNLSEGKSLIIMRSSRNNNGSSSGDNDNISPLQGARHCSKGFTCMTSFSSHNNPW